MRITILYLLHKFSYGGTERVVVNLLNHSSSNIHNYVCSFSDYDETFLNELSCSRDIVFALRKREGNDLSIPLKIASFCNKHQVDIIHSMGWATYAEGLLAAKLFRKKRRFIYSYRGKTIEDTIRIPQRRILAQRFFSYFCDAILTNSEVSKKEYSQQTGIDENKINVVYNGVDVNKFNGEISTIAYRESFNLGEKDLVIGSVARFDPVKNLGVLVTAFSKIDRSLLSQCKLFLIGDGPELSSLHNLVRELTLNENVVFAGMRHDIPNCLKCMDIYVQPSIFENIPNSILEAMASGLPVVTTNVGGIPEIVKDGETGLLVNVGSGGELKRTIELLLKNPEKRKSLGKKGKELVRREFSIEKMVSDYERMYEELVSKNW